MDEAVVRLDKWLWFARVAKTRSLAQKLIRAGSVRVNRVKANSPAKRIRPGDVLTISRGGRVLVYKVVAAGSSRQSYAQARLLYEDLSAATASGPAGQIATETAQRIGRPTKRDRRRILQLRAKSLE